MSWRRRVVMLASCVVPAISAGAQSTERAIFLVRLGRDTLAVEDASFGNGRAEGTLRLRAPLMRVHRVMTVSPAGVVQSADMTTGTGMRGDSAQTHTVLTITGDSGVIRIEDPRGVSAAQSRSVAIARGAVPFANLSGQTLELILRRARTLGGDTVSVPVLLAGGQSLPLLVTRIAGDSAILSIGGVDIRAHTDDAGRLLGAFIPSQGAYFDRLPGDSPAASWTPATVSYDAPAGAPYAAETVRFRTPAGIIVAGTLTMPKHNPATRVPAVVMITGTGSQDRDEAVPSLGAYRPFREIADTLSRRGIAVLRLDDRGIGGTEMGAPTATSADLADDIRAGLAWLHTRSDIDPARLGLVGHSEGGMIAPMIAATDSTLHAIVLIAGPSKTGRAISAFQRKYLIDHDAAIPVARRASLLAESDRAVEKLFATPGWYQFWADHDPLATARNVRIPTLILQGETDTQITPEQAGELAAAMRAGGNRNTTVRLFPHMNHLMLEDASGDAKGYGTLSSYAVRRDFLGVLADWLAATM